MGKVCEVNNYGAVDTEEVGRGNGLFNLAKLHAYNLFIAVCEVDIRIVAVGFDVEDFIGAVGHETALWAISARLF